MPDLPLIGGHAPGTSSKAFSETAVNVFIESRGKVGMMRNRPGYERVDYFASSPYQPGDTGNAIDDITEAAGVVTVDASTANVRYGYDVGDSITIVGSAVAAYNTAHIITSIQTDQETFTFALGGSPADDIGTAATVGLTGDIYTKEVRAIIRIDQKLGLLFAYMVIGNRVYLYDPFNNQISESTTQTTRLLTTSGKVSWAKMGNTLTDQIVICDGNAGYARSGSNALAKTLHFTGGAWVDTLTASATATFMDGYIIRDDLTTTGRFLYSDLYDVTVENSFNFATAEGSFDDLFAVLADRRELFMFGESTTEIWYNVGGKDLPFQRSQGGFIQAGTIAPMTVARFDNSIVWLANDNRGGLTVVRAGEGYQPQMISTEQLNVQLNSAKAFISNAFANVFRFEGHEFYCLTLPGNYGRESAAGGGGFADNITPVTFAYDSNSKEWFKWESHNDLLATDDHGRWMVTAVTYMHDSANRGLGVATTESFRNTVIVGGRDGTGEIYALTAAAHVDEHVDGNQVIQCERTMPPVQGPDYQRINAGPVELVTDHDATELATAVLSYAKDSKTFGSTLSRTLTATSSRFLWKRIGRAYRWIFRITQDTTATLPVRWLRLTSRKLGETTESGLGQ